MSRSAAVLHKVDFESAVYNIDHIYMRTNRRYQLVCTMNVGASSCLPFACNQIKGNLGDKCAVCLETLPFNTHEYPVPARSSFEVPPSHDQYVTFDPRLVLPADISNGRNHLYVCKNCKIPGRPKQGPKQHFALHTNVRTPGIAAILF